MSEEDKEIEWLPFKLCHDLESDLWSVKWVCQICNVQRMGDPVDMAVIGEEIQKRLPVYLCRKCQMIVQAYQKKMAPIKTVIPEDIIANPITGTEQQPRSRAIPCRNHVEFKDGCIACLNVNNSKGGFR